MREGMDSLTAADHAAETDVQHSAATPVFRTLHRSDPYVIPRSHRFSVGHGDRELPYAHAPR